MKTLVILVILGLSTLAFGQTATLIIVPALVAPTVTITPATMTVTAGQTATYSVTVAGTAGKAVPTGTVTLEAAPAGSTSYTVMTTAPLTNGAVTCSFTSTGTPGTFTVHPLYGGDRVYSPTK